MRKSGISPGGGGTHSERPMVLTKFVQPVTTTAEVAPEAILIRRLL